MAKHKGRHLLDSLDVGDAKGVFGIAYSILTWSGTFKGLGISPSSWAKVIGKGFEDGHATAFMIDVEAGEFTMTGMGDEWVFYGGDLDAEDWARSTPNAATDVYYTTGDNLVEKFKEVRAKLEGQKAAYAVLVPNTPFTTRHENCVSSTHYVVYEMGLGYWAATKGAWVPSFSNYMTWAASKWASWKYHRFAGCNTHMPD